MSIFLAARDFLAPAGRPDIGLYLEDAHAGTVVGRLHPLVERTFLWLAMWPLFVECYSQALARADWDTDFHDAIVVTLVDILRVKDEIDPMPAIASWAGEMTGYAHVLAMETGAPRRILMDSVASYGQVYGGGSDWTRANWYVLDPHGRLEIVCHDELKRMSRRLLALRDLPSDRRGRIVAVADAIIGRIVLQRMRDAA